MKQSILFILFSFCGFNLFGQKPVLDSAAIKAWSSIGNSSISDDGKYVSYNIINQPVGSGTLVIQDTANTWRRSIVGANSRDYCGDNKKFVFQRTDTLFFLTLGEQKERFISNVNSYGLVPTDKKEWICYQLKDSAKSLVILNVSNGEELRFDFTTGYSFNIEGNVILLKRDSVSNNRQFHLLQFVMLPEKIVRTIWSQETDKDIRIGKCSFGKYGKQLAFLVQEKSAGKVENTIWLYQAGMETSNRIITNKTAGIDSGLVIDNSFLSLSSNGKWVNFKLRKQEAAVLKTNDNAVKVDIWHYKDITLQTEQLLNMNARMFSATFNIEGRQVQRIEREGEKLQQTSSTGNFAFITDNNGISDREPWVTNFKNNAVYLLSLERQSRKLINANIGLAYSFSPKDRYFVYYDLKSKNYCSYDLELDKTYNISYKVPVKLSNEYKELISPGNSIPPVGIAGWLNDDSGILVYDNYDIWKLDPKGMKLPINVTKGYGQSHNLKFRLVGDGLIRENRPLLLTAFNSTNKYNGFYRKVLNESKDPELLSFGPFKMYIGESQTPITYQLAVSNRPTKARDSDVWVIMKMTAKDAPNYFVTRDFKAFKPISDLQPQKKYNWMTAELINWKMPDGRMNQGILYKPENFDSTKKYPVIFNYYEHVTSRLFEFPAPEFTAHNINIPWFVSRGYLVFTPDMTLSIAKVSGITNAESAYNSVVSSANYLKKLSYVDANSMAIQGHSYGGHETNDLVTMTNIFAAAAEVAGVSDFVSAYLSLGGPLDKPSVSRQNGAESGQGRMGMNFWEGKKFYIKNSPIYHADKVTTPLLIMHNKADDAVPWGQGVEMYLALRRLNKKVWMLQYDEGAHQLFLEKDAADYTIRLTQFFDHYLKSAPPPKWMTVGIPARLKGIQTGYELDPNGSCGKDCKICKYWNEKYKKDPSATWKEIERRKVAERWE